MELNHLTYLVVLLVQLVKSQATACLCLCSHTAYPCEWAEVNFQDRLCLPISEIRRNEYIEGHCSFHIADYVFSTEKRETVCVAFLKTTYLKHEFR
jgi:hypothetical protein